ncbi:GNAT family N-acetyltransferase [Alkalicoccus urumqiensis]|uniref:GNAT family N-acetyltransferase n=1 Tax=Alkalicoccus urumqiensis TaxID=1548213 RepID=A0A2P6MD93_ALKUR|nr:GNAT family N-acetyltransferase [Alkalicoccus urumqiensis]PRO64259.1 GNAT family N-acetyltransferase [Alkalicoccus urumqiensis]
MVTVRSYTLDDYEGLLLIQQEAFPPPFPEDLWWSREEIAAHVETFPEGAMIAFVDGEPAASATALRTNLDGWHTWAEISDNGMIRGTHQPDGDTLYGIDVCVRPAYRGRGAADALYTARKELVQKLGLRRYAAVCRIPGFAESGMDVESYVEAVASGKKKDPVLSFMIRQGLTVTDIVPDYLDDEESGHYGVQVEWYPPDGTPRRNR